MKLIKNIIAIFIASSLILSTVIPNYAEEYDDEELMGSENVIVDVPVDVSDNDPGFAFKDIEENTEDIETEDVNAETEEEIIYEDQVFVEDVNGSIVTISGYLPVGITYSIEEIEDVMSYELMINDTFDTNMSLVKLYDVNFYYKEEIFEPDEHDTYVTLSIENVQCDDISIDDLSIYHIDDNVVTEIESNIEDNAIIFNADHFSLYGVAGAKAASSINYKYAFITGGKVFNKKIKSLAAGTTVSWTEEDSIVTAIKWIDEPFVSDVTLHEFPDQFAPIYARLNGTVVELYTQATSVFIYFEMTYMFSEFTKLESVDLSKYRSYTTSSETQPTSLEKMFSKCSSLKTVDFSSSYDYIVPTNMHTMFEYCFSLEYVNFNHLYTGYTTNFADMFRGCNALKTVDFTGVSFQSITEEDSKRLFDLGNYSSDNPNKYNHIKTIKNLCNDSDYDICLLADNYSHKNSYHFYTFDVREAPLYEYIPGTIESYSSAPAHSSKTTYISNRWDNKTYHTKVMFFTNGGSDVEPGYTLYSTPFVHNKFINYPTPVKDGSTFGGWYIDCNLTIPYTNEDDFWFEDPEFWESYPIHEMYPDEYAEYNIPDDYVALFAKWIEPEWHITVPDNISISNQSFDIQIETPETCYTDIQLWFSDDTLLFANRYIASFYYDENYQYPIVPDNDITDYYVIKSHAGKCLLQSVYDLDATTIQNNNNDHITIYIKKEAIGSEPRAGSETINLDFDIDVDIKTTE